MLYLTALTAFVAIGTVGVIAAVAKKSWPGEKRIKEELKKMSLLVDKISTDLLPLDKEGLDLLAFYQEHRKVSVGMSTEAQGVFTTLYHEQAIAYSYKKFLGGENDNNALLYMRTAKKEFVYHLRKKGITLFINGKVVGDIRDQGTKLYGARKKRLLAQINTTSQKEYMPVVVYDKEVGNISKPMVFDEKQPNHRMFQFMATQISPEEKALFLGLSMLFIILKSIEKK